MTKLTITRDMTPKTPAAATAISPTHDSLSNSVHAVKRGGDTQVFTQQQPTFSTCIIGWTGSYSYYNAGERDSRVKRTPCSNDANTTHEVQKYVEVLLLALLYWMQ